MAKNGSDISDLPLLVSFEIWVYHIDCGLSEVYRISNLATPSHLSGSETSTRSLSMIQLKPELGKAF